ncbi:MAG: DUF362 domain-containing protein [Desulfobacterales bacterium]|jgi:uncharacterized protein (DUF362 family)|nr:DUF362 domain-containing protein [Desulfobacterales bacterium]
MNNNHHITRRESLKKLMKISGGIAVSGFLPLPFKTGQFAIAAQSQNKFLVEGVGQTENYSIKTLTRKVFDAAGGIRTFISKGDVVVIKPNVSWARAPHLAATTNPEVMQAVIELCQEAGAKKVRIADNTIHDAQRCFAITGVGAIAKKTGADLIVPRDSLMREMNLHGHRLDVWPVFTPIIEADKLINLPVAKDHGLSVVTLGIKNWIGAVGGRRSALHQDIHQTIVDLAQFFKPTITLIDATRIMINNGPSGGNESDVRVKNRLILSNDPVAADTKAATLFDLDPNELGFIQLGNKWGLGTKDLTQLKQLKVAV